MSVGLSSGAGATLRNAANTRPRRIPGLGGFGRMRGID
jgi:hypothetical protein